MHLQVCTCGCDTRNKLPRTSWRTRNGHASGKYISDSPPGGLEKLRKWRSLCAKIVDVVVAKWMWMWTIGGVGGRGTCRSRPRKTRVFPRKQRISVEMWTFGVERQTFGDYYVLIDYFEASRVRRELCMRCMVSGNVLFGCGVFRCVRSSYKYLRY